MENVQMKIEIEITEDDIAKNIVPKIKSAMIEIISGYQFNDTLKSEIKKQLYSGLGQMIDEQLKNSALIEAKIAEEIQAKIKRQLTQLMSKK